MNHLSNETAHSDFVRGAKTVHVITSAFFLLCGIVGSFWNWDLGHNYHIAVGIACILIGAAGILGYFSNDAYRLAFQSDFALGIFAIVLGAIIMASPEKVVELLPVAVAMMALVDGGNKGQIAYEGYTFGMHFWFVVALCALAEIAMGIITIFCAYKDIKGYFLIGITMIVIGAVNVFTTLYSVRLTKNKQTTTFTTKK